MLQFCHWLEQTSIGSAIRQSLWLFPAIETIHLLGMAALVGAITVLDLRLLGWTAQKERPSDSAQRLIRWAWLGFAVQLFTGGLLFCSEAVRIYTNPAFRLKMLLLLLAGLQALIFQVGILPKLSASDDPSKFSAAAKITGASSLLLWVAIVAAGRFIGFV